jgi:hypothetical protein
MIRNNPSFYAMNKVDQDKYKINQGEYLDQKFNTYLYKELLNVDKSTLDEDYDLRLEDSVNLVINQNTTLLRGIGENYFHLVESLDENETILSFKTLYDYDLSEFNFQEQCKINDNDFHKEKITADPYQLKLNFNWARCYLTEENEKGDLTSKFYYLTLSSLAAHIEEELSQLSIDTINKLIPNDYEDGKDHGKLTEEGAIYDIVLNAKGLEEPLDDLNKESWKYLAERHEALSLQFNEEEKKTVWIQDKSVENDPSKIYVFSDKEAIKVVNLDNWQENTESIESKDFSYIDKILNDEKDKLTKFLNEKYEFIIQNHDPKVVKIKPKKMKVVFAKGLKI